jgi:hypothetical protein
MSIFVLVGIKRILRQELLISAAIWISAILFAPFATTLWRHLCKLGSRRCCQAKAHGDHAAFHAAIAAAESKPVSKYEIRRSQFRFVLF